MLLVLDSCERMIEAAAALAEEVFNRAPGVHILATSREPLRAEGERVQRLLPLDVPAASSKLTAREAPVQSRERLGGLLRYYHREAARTGGAPQMNFLTIRGAGPIPMLWVGRAE
jgi:predicted ATPase